MSVYPGEALLTSCPGMRPLARGGGLLSSFLSLLISIRTGLVATGFVRALWISSASKRGTSCPYQNDSGWLVGLVLRTFFAEARHGAASSASGER